ncbi:MAG: type II CAAX endopeptidase family protein [Candidatus Bipolaricaulota bacterium]
MRTKRPRSLGDRMARAIAGRFREQGEQVERRLSAGPRVPTTLLAAFFLCYVGLSLFINLVVFPSPWLDPVARATRGLISPTLVVNLALLAICVGGVLRLAGGLRWRDVAGGSWAFRQGAASVLLLWVITQAIAAATVRLAGEAVLLDPAWTGVGSLAVVGNVLAQVAGNALFEEIAFRGVLLPRVFRRLRTKRPWLRPLLAVALSQALFALFHIPNRIYSGLPAADFPLELLRLFGLGSLFAVVYLRTGSLTFTLGVHALLNEPASLVGGAPATEITVALVATTVAVGTLWGRPTSPSDTT